MPINSDGIATTGVVTTSRPVDNSTDTVENLDTKISLLLWTWLTLKNQSVMSFFFLKIQFATISYFLVFKVTNAARLMN